MDDQRRIVDDVPVPVDLTGEPRKSAEARPLTKLGDTQRSPQVLGLFLAGDGEDVAQLDSVVPDVERPEHGQLRHAHPIRPDRVLHDVAIRPPRDPEIATRQRDARREALDVPLPRCRKRLVEVVDVEEQVPLRSGEDAEVPEMGVAARLYPQCRRGRRGEVVGHQHR